MDKKTIIDFKYNLIRQINKFRNSHGVKSLRSDHELDEMAQNTANQLVQNDKQYDSQNPEETIYFSRSFLSPANLAKVLYDENSQYDFNSNNNKPSNFTKMIWKNAHIIGFGMEKDRYNNFVFVIKYHSIDNRDNLQNNVFPFGTRYSETFNPNNNNKDNYSNREQSLPNNKYTKYNRREPSSDARNKTPSFNFDKFCIEALNAHNYYRRYHHAGPLTINNQLSRIAENYSRRLAYTIRGLQHSTNRYNNEALGENLYFCFGKEPTGNETTKSWYDEIQYHDFNSDYGCSYSGHFTQLIWKNSKEVGFGVTKNKDGQWFVVANYFPAGNIMGKFRENVLIP